MVPVSFSLVAFVAFVAFVDFVETAHARHSPNTFWLCARLIAALLLPIDAILSANPLYCSRWKHL